MAVTPYTYTVRDRQGRVVDGRLDAESEAAVRARLRTMGVIPLDIQQARVGRRAGLRLSRRVKLKDLAMFARQLATMIDSGLTLLRALTILCEQSSSEQLRDTLRAVKQDVETGNSLSVALARHPQVFPTLMVNMTRAGEVGGFLDQSMLQVAEAFEAEVRLRGKIKAAMTYPVVVFALAMVMLVAMLIFVVPVFDRMFTNLGGTLPLPTRLLVLASRALKLSLPVLAAAAAAAAWWWRRHRHHPRVREVLDPLKLRLPVFGPLFQKIALARFARNLSTLLAAGVPILQSLQIVADTTGSVVIGRALRAVQDSVRQGESISAPLAGHEVFPQMVTQMIAVGEDTGATDRMLAKIAQFYDQEVEATTEALTALVEPLMIAFLGGLVGSMIVALYLPIFKVFDLIK